MEDEDDDSQSCSAAALPEEFAPFKGTVYLIGGSESTTPPPATPKHISPRSEGCEESARSPESCDVLDEAILLELRRQ